MGRSNFPIEIEISSRGTGNQSRPAIESQVLDRPLDENQNAALELDEVHQMDECPDEPSRKTRNMDTEDVRHRMPPANDGHVAFVEIFERRQVLCALYFPRNRLRGVGSLLHGHLSDARQWLPAGAWYQRQVANH